MSCGVSGVSHCAAPAQKISEHNKRVEALCLSEKMLGHTFTHKIENPTFFQIKSRVFGRMKALC